MKFIVSRDVLYKNLSAISGVLGTSSTLPILDNFLFTVEGEILTLTASDLDATMTAIVQLSNVEGEGAVAVPSKTILETLKLMEDTPIVFDIDLENHILKFSAINGEYDSSCFPGEEYPAMKTMENPQTFEIQSQILQRAISKTLFATGNDELRPNMMGVLCELSDENITFVATDAHKLVCYNNSAVKVDEPISFILPKKPIAQLKTILGGVNDNVKVEYSTDTHHIRFSFGNIVLFSSLKEGKFPAYQAVIPKDNPNKFIVDRKAFHKSICRVGIYSNQSTYQVRISLNEEKTEIKAEDLDFSNKAEENIAGAYTGETMDIGFNSKFLREMLENMDCAEISLEMSLPNRAALIIPTEQDSPEENLLMLIMPVMLNY
ncbi:MAG: DNA polymerase III subunit beta [Bacteroidales bacterium]|jgi:DNA polymerase-3 subunit beta|nr:DNA polymerase III subunit beta [Bacteroidales bacterium]